MSLHMKIIKARKAQGAYLGGARYAMGRGRAGQQGGWLGDIGKAIAKVGGTIFSGVPVIGSALTAIGAGALDKKKKGVTAIPANTLTLAPSSGPGSGGFGMPNIGPGYAPETVATGGSMDPGTGMTLFGGGKAIPAGYRLNKSRYYINDPLIPGSEQGREIEPGSRVVKIRKRNPYNPKAASRAMSRLAALSQGMKTLERQLTKLAPRKRTAPARACKHK